MVTEAYSVSIDTDDNIIKFAKEYPIKKCKHKNVYISVEKNVLHCKDCKEDINPIFWIKSHLHLLNSADQRNKEMLAEAQIIQEKLNKTSVYLCKHCHQDNEIDFKRLLSKNAILRRMETIDNEVGGYQVQV